MAEWPTTSTSVTSAEIVDGSIVDADVSASAAIQASKLSGVETPAGAQTKADAAQAAAEATAATDATAKADAAEAAAVATAATDATMKANAAQTAAEATAAAALTAHEADTTSVHGITDTTALETTTGAQAKADAAQTAAEATADGALSTHTADTTSVHGITDTSTLIVEGDARLTDERTPTDGSVTAAKLASGQNLTLLGATFTGTVPGSLNAVKFSMSGASATSASTGGVVNITTTGHTGAGVVVYSNRGNDAGGRLVSIWADNAAFNQSAFYCRYDGVANAAVIDNQGTGTSNVALTVTSTNAADTTLGISGTQTTRAVLKITHTGGAGTSGAAITIQKDGTDTAAQGIFGDADATATGKWLNLRLGGTEVFVVSAGGNLDAAGTITSGGTAVVLTDDSRLTDARTPTTHAASHAAGGADVVTPLSIAALGLADTRASVLGRRWDFATDPFDTDLGEFTVVQGTRPTVASGRVAAASTASHVVATAASLHPDVELTQKITPGVITAAAFIGFRMRLLDASNSIYPAWGRTGSGAGVISIYSLIAGSLVLRSTTALTFTPGTAYWLRARVVADTITCEWWTTHPDLGGSPSKSITYTLASGTVLGAGVRGKAGLAWSVGQADDYSDDLTIRPLTGRVRRRQIQQFTASGTWTAPANALLDPDATYEVVGIGCGGPGASGARQPSGTQTSGGSGGASGSVLRARGKVADMAATTGTVTIGAVGTPGAAVTSDSTNGNSGTSSGHSSISGIVGTNLNARAGSPGVAGSGSTHSGGAAALGSPGGLTGGTATVGADGSAAASTTNGSGAIDSAPGGGGGGGGMPTTPAFKNGGNGSTTGTTSQGGAGGTSAGAAGSVNSTYLIPLGLGLSAGPGPGGGASSTTGAGGDGGSGATAGYGAGGGGGGSSLNGSNSGAGGAAGPAAIAIGFEWTEAG